jgi:hypothetical protein
MATKTTYRLVFQFILSLAVVWLSADTLLAQKERDIRIIEFGADGEKVSKKSYDNLILKTNPISFLFGTQTLEAERELSDMFSMQGGLGVTFRSAKIGYLDLVEAELGELSGRNSFCGSTQWANDICDKYTDYTHRKQIIGYRLALSGRLFFDNNGYEGLYISPSLLYTRNRYRIPEAIESNLSTVMRQEGAWKPERESLTDFTIRLGYSVLHDRLMHEAYIGAGIRNFKALREDLGRDATNVVRNGVREFGDTIVHLEIGVRLGIQL